MLVRSEQEVFEDIQSNVLAEDSSLDVEKGPIPSVFIGPMSKQIAALEERQEHVRLITTLNFETVATADEVRSIAKKLGLNENLGERVTGRQVFGMTRRPQPGEVISIVAGTIVSSADNQYRYRVTRTAKILGDQAAIYYQPSTRTYEVETEIESVGFGPAFRLPANRVNKLLTPISGIEFTINRKAYSGGGSGSVRSSTISLISQIKDALFGRDASSFGGIITKIRSIRPYSVKGVSVVLSGDRGLFYRPIVQESAIDVYVHSTDNTAVASDDFTASAGAVEFTLGSPPVSRISTVTVNGYTVSNWSLSKDTTKALQKSARAEDKLVFDAGLNDGDAVHVVYEYNSVVRDIQRAYSTASGTLFNLDVLVREPIEVPVTVRLSMKYMSTTFGADALADDVKMIARNTVELNRMGPLVLYPQTLKTAVEGIPAVAAANVVYFHPTGNSYTDVQPVRIQKNEIPIIDDATFYVG